MKRTIQYISYAVIAVAILASCSDSFLEEKRNYDNVNSDIYNYYSGANGRLNDIYSWTLPTANVTDGTLWRYPSAGSADILAKCTEEYSGFGTFVNPEAELTSTGTGNAVPDWFMGTQTNIQESVYGRIRNINDCIEGIQGGTLSDGEKNILLGQCYFFRAGCYLTLVEG